MSLSAADPINLLGIVTPGARLPALAGNRFLRQCSVAIHVAGQTNSRDGHAGRGMATAQYVGSATAQEHGARQDPIGLTHHRAGTMQENGSVRSKV